MRLGGALSLSSRSISFSLSYHRQTRSAHPSNARELYTRTQEYTPVVKSPDKYLMGINPPHTHPAHTHISIYKPLTVLWAMGTKEMDGWLSVGSSGWQSLWPKVKCVRTECVYRRLLDREEHTYTAPNTPRDY